LCELLAVDAGAWRAVMTSRSSRIRP
jgi:hypothetical protein